MRGTKCRGMHIAEVRRVTEEPVAEVHQQAESKGVDLRRGTQDRRTSGAEVHRTEEGQSADLRSLDIEELRIFAALYW